MEQEAVMDTAVICKAGDNTDSFLVAYLVLADEAPDMEQIRQNVAQRLPSYMIPSYWIPIDKIPLNSNGKLDRKRLPAPEFGDEPRAKLPADQLEGKLLDIWSDVLGLATSKISTDSDFFSLGGHSLKATAMVSKIRSLLKLDVPLSEVFNSPTIKGIASYIDNKASGREIAANQQIIPLKINANDLPNMFFIHDGLGQVTGYLKLCDLLADTHNYWGIQTKTETDIHLDKKTLQDLVDEHVDTIKNTQPGGPYYIAGWSMGGAIAFSVARCLEKQGHEVSFLGLIDAGIPKKIFKRREKLKGNIYTFHAGKENKHTLDDWRPHCRGTFESYYITGDHHSILTPPHVIELAEKFRRAVEKK